MESLDSIWTRIMERKQPSVWLTSLRRCTRTARNGWSSQMPPWIVSAASQLFPPPPPPFYCPRCRLVNAPTAFLGSLQDLQVSTMGRFYSLHVGCLSISILSSYISFFFSLELITGVLCLWAGSKICRAQKASHLEIKDPDHS